MKSLRLSALAAALVLAACTTSTPTDPAAAGTRASFDGGNTIGSGNGASGSGGGTSTSDGGNGTTTTDSTGTNRGGGSLGSGN